jgi:ribosomal peptide maturation radical SAM protein 1
VNGRSLGEPARPVQDLDALPTPDHSDYFRSIARAGSSSRGGSIVPLESSRGCWWAAREACAFCGVNGELRGYRSKSPDRILTELKELAFAWPGRLLDVVDNLVSRRFVTDVLTRLPSGGDSPLLYFKVRPDISRSDLEAIASAGARLMCGIESLDDRLLTLMGKGSDGLEGIRLLKRCADLGVSVDWNLLCRLPGESFRDYVGQVDLMHTITHLQPPAAVPNVLVERFSTCWNLAAERGFGKLRPAAAYRHVYPFAESDLREIAYYFDHEYQPDFRASLQHRRLIRGAEDWRRRHPHAELRMLRTAEGAALVVDSRQSDPPVTVALDSLELLLLDACDDIRTVHELETVAARELGIKGNASAVADALQSLISRRFVVRIGERCLSVVIPTSGARRAEPVL